MKRTLAITTGVSVGLVSAGVILGLALAGGSSSHPVVVRPADQAVVITTSDSSVVAAPSTPDAVTSSSAAAVPAPTIKAAPVTQPVTKANDVQPEPTYVAISSLAPGDPVPNLAPLPATTDQGLPVLPAPHS